MGLAAAGQRARDASRGATSPACRPTVSRAWASPGCRRIGGSSAAQRAGESAHRARPRRGGRRAPGAAARQGVRGVSGAARPARPGGRHAVGRRAADAGHRAGHDAGAQDHPARRADRGPDAAHGLADPRDRRRAAPRGRGHPPRGAERAAHAGGRRAASTSWRRAWCATTRRPPTCARTRPSSTSTWECERGHSRRPDPRADRQRPGQRHDPGAGGLGAHADLRHHGRGQLRPRRPGDAGRLRGRDHHRRHRQLLDRAARGRAGDGGVRRRAPDQHAAAAAGPRSAHHDPGHLRRLAGAAEVRAVAVGTVGPQDPGADHRPVRALLPPVPVVPAWPPRCWPAPSSARLWLFLKRGKYGIWIRATTQDRVMASAMGIPVPLGAHRGVRHRRGHGGGQRRALRAARRRHPDDGLRLHAARVHRGGGRRDGQSRRLDPRRDLHQPAGGLRLAGRQPGPGGDRLVRRR